MNLKKLRAHLLAKEGAYEDFPFGIDVLTAKVNGKIFALVALEAKPLWINLKCEPFLAMELRERYSSIIPGYHMNKVHWNTIILDGEVPDGEVKRLIDMSYELVVKKGGKKKR
ncbi:MAG: MmcQ/YjbR family DNA-binding protein [Spirochaetes bacterium]|nr:MAG: MmcQ/YjbR family DNA-binding protein [Spirochaetota bacterium]